MSMPLISGTGLLALHVLLNQNQACGKNLLGGLIIHDAS
jgi:hypothetical protein